MSLLETVEEENTEQVAENSHGRREHKVGSIVRMSLKSFVAYKFAEIKPGPQLNIILGPNGSGKSTFVCAMILGLGGSPSLLGRAKELREFIKYGYKSASIEIEIKELEPPNVIIRRFIHQDNSSEWSINSKSSTHAKVIDLVRSYNIHVDNLCQFLPQDRISAFAEMDPSLLLKETELSIGGKTLFDKHIVLINLKLEESKRSVQIKTESKHLNELKEQNKAIEHDFIRLKERRDMLEKLKVLEKKKYFLAYEKQRKLTSRLRADFKEAKMKIANFEKVLSPLLEANEEKRKTLESGDAMLADTNKEVNQLNRRFDKILEDLKEASNVGSLLNNKMIRFEEREERRVVETENLKNSLEMNEKHLNQVKLLAESSADKKKSLVAQLEELKNSERNLQIKLSVGETDMQKLQKDIQIVQMQLDSQKDMINQRKSLLPGNIVQLYDWIMANDQHGSLQDKVYGPLMFEMNVLDDKFAPMIEKVVSKQYRTAFIVQCVHDRKTIYLKSKSLGGIQPLIMYNPNPQPEPPTAYSVSQVSQFGIQGFLSNTFNAPPLVKAELCRQCRLNDIPYGRDVEAHLESIFALKSISVFLSYTSLYHKVHSKYAPTSYTIIENVGKARQLARMDQEAFKVTQNNYTKVEQQIEQLSKSMNDTRSYLSDVRQQIHRMKSELDQLNSSTDYTILEIRKREIEAHLLDLNVDSAEEERREIQAKIDENLVQQVETADRISKASSAILSKMSEYSVQLLEHSKICEELRVLEEQIEEKKLGQRDLYEECNSAQEDYLKSKKLALELKSVFEENKPVDEDVALWDSMPNDIKVLDSMKVELEFRISSITTDSALVEKYESRVVEIESLSSKLDFDRDTLREKQIQIQNLKNQWVSDIAEIVKKVDSNFSSFFNNINCRGNVKFYQDPEDDFDKYGVEIMVSYRSNESMKKLDSRAQSGGERSVATMIYLISLQQLSDCPVRLVDEINQGMDEKNERLVFNQVAQQSSMDNTPQYFLITPKLIPNLSFTRNIDIICVFNGPYMVPQKEWPLD